MSGGVSRTGMKITTILVTMVVAVVAVILCCCILIFLSLYRSAMIRTAMTTGTQAVSQVSNTVANYMRDMNQAMSMVEWSMSESDSQQASLMGAFLIFRPDVVAVTSYTADGELVDCWSNGRSPLEDIYMNLSFNKELAEESEEGYISAPHVETIFEGYYPWVVTMTAPIATENNERWVSLDLSFSSISAYINNVSIGQRGYCFLMDSSGNIVYHPQQQLIYAGLKSEDTVTLMRKADGTYVEDTVIYSLNSVAESGWRVVGVSFVDELVNKNVAEMIRLSLIMGVFLLLTAILTSWLLSRLLSRPLRGLADAMESFETNADNFTYRSVGGTREVQELSGSFRHMVLHIQQLMTTVREEEINLRKTELKALQAQINPHFLYNTLDSIAWMCEQGKTGDAVNMVHALARLFRISISRGHELIPIELEIQHAESYLQIQKYRYKNQFSYRFEVDPQCVGYYCNKITLQPIIENAINHGLRLMVDEGLIVVRVFREGDDIIFRVTDNGVGMSPEQVKAVMERGPDSGTGIGIRNVNDRLKIYFGKEYGLTIESEVDVGTTVEIRMPMVKEGDGGEK